MVVASLQCLEFASVLVFSFQFSGKTWVEGLGLSRFRNPGSFPFLGGGNGLCWMVGWKVRE